MIRFNCDYNEGAHPRILEELVKTNMEQTPGYGEDPYCEKAAKVIKDLCKKEDAAVHFLVGGTQANLTVISSILRPHQAVICVEEGHINVHETGAIEACGHKVMTIQGKDGKIDAEQIKEVCTQHWSDSSHEHSRSLCIFPTRRNLERCTASRNWKRYETCVMNVDYICF